MHEQPSHKPEESPEKERHEQTPSKESIGRIFEELATGGEYETVETQENDDGLYLWEVKAVDKNGDEVRYTYFQSGNPHGYSGPTIIDAYWPEEKQGQDAAWYKDGSWEINEKLDNYSRE